MIERKRIWSDSDGWIDVFVESIGSGPVTNSEGWQTKASHYETMSSTYGVRKAAPRLGDTSDRVRCKYRCGRLAEKKRLECSVCRKSTQKRNREERERAPAPPPVPAAELTPNTCVDCRGRVKPADWRAGVRRCRKCRAERREGEPGLCRDCGAPLRACDIANDCVRCPKCREKRKYAREEAA